VPVVVMAVRRRSAGAGMPASRLSITRWAPAARATTPPDGLRPARSAAGALHSAQIFRVLLSTSKEPGRTSIKEVRVTRQEIEDALFREAMAADAFAAEPSPANRRLWDAARRVVDRAIEEVS
jgi:hypothetical protein